MQDIVVVGAGMVGVSTALALQERGHFVTLVDRSRPGQETSHGNAGIIQVEAAEPYALPRDPRTLMRFGLKLDNAVNYHLSALPGMIRPLWSYFLNSAPARHKVISATYSRLTRKATQDHAPWIEASQADALIQKGGFFEMQRDQATLDREVQRADRLHDEYGVASRILDTEMLAKEEPALTRPFAGAIHWTGSWTCSDPGGLTRAYTQLFINQGGLFANGDAQDLRASGSGWTIATSHGPIWAERAVLALGPWSATILRRLGYRIDMIGKRGYHQHFASPAMPRRPLYDVAAAALYCPMKAGLRVTCGAELARMDAPRTPVQIRYAEKKAREVLMVGQPLDAEPWVGTRPCMPDMLPVIGQMPRHKELWVNFGHGHQGFTLGPTTAKLLAEVMDGNATDPAADLFSPLRLHAL